MDPIQLALVGAGAFWLLSKFAKPAPAQSQQNQNQNQNQQQGLATTGGPTSKLVGDIVGLATTGIGVAAGIITPIVAAHGTSTAAAVAAEAAAETVAAVAFDVGAAIYGGVLAIAIVATIITAAIYNAIRVYHDAVINLLGYDVRAGSPAQLAFKQRLEVQNAALAFFKQAFIGNPNVPQAYTTSGNGLPGTYFTGSGGRALPQSAVASATQVCFFLGIAQVKARNDAQTAFFRFLGDSDAQQISTGESFPGDAFSQYLVGPLLSGQGPGGTYNALKSPLAAGFPFSTLSGDGKPVSFAQLQQAALNLFGPTYGKAVARVQAIGIAEAITLASITGYTAFWPGDEAFVRAIAANTAPSWVVQYGTFWATTGVPTPTQLATWWMIDPVSGFRVAPITSREKTAFVMSIPGVDTGGGKLSGYASAGRFSGFGAQRALNARARHPIFNYLKGR